MKLKQLILGSASAIAFAGGAQAADLSIAEPVDYVRVCDAFGTGYYYVPGTDVCLKIWGFVRFDVDLYSHTDGDEDDDYFYEGSTSSNHYDFSSGAYLNFTAKSMTGWGPLEAFMSMYNWGFNEAKISLGPLTVGYIESTFAMFTSGITTHHDGPYSGWFDSQHRANLVRLAWAMNGFGLAVALEEPNYEEYSDGDSSYSAMPDIVAALTVSNASFDGKVSFVYSDFLTQDNGTGWAVAAGVTIKLDSVAPGDQLLLKAAYGTAQPFVIGCSLFCDGAANFEDEFDDDRPVWSAMAGIKHYFQPNFFAAALVNYATGLESDDGRMSAFLAEFNLSYSPAPTLWISPGVRWVSFNDHDGTSDDFTDWTATIRVQKDLF